MKKIFTLMGVLAFVGTGFAQENNEGLYAEYQLPNPDFEEGWTYNEIKSSFGTGVTYSEETPNCWNSFYTAVGEYAPLALKAMANQTGSVKATTGYDGTGYAALIFSRKNFLQ